MIWLLKWLICGPPPGPHNCKTDGHKYRPRFDEMLDPRLSEETIKLNILMAFDPEEGRRCVMAKIYVKDICDGCGDVVERLEGLNAMEVLAHQAKRIA